MKTYPRQYSDKGLGYLNNVFPGIYWADAELECPREHFNILTEATIGLMDELSHNRLGHDQN